ncbi:MAG: AAA family ATPase [Ferruginibacter sp.]
MSSENKYEILETIHDGDHSTIYKTRHERSGKDVILKQSKSSANAGLYNEYNLMLEQAEDKSIIEITELSKKPALMRQFYIGKSLRQEIDDKNSGLVFFFNVCFKIVEALQKVHSKNIIHKDLSPENILINLAENKVHIIDFEIGTGQQFQHTNYKGASVIEGNLSYISPEQTGRMNRLVDYRSDFYSLGVIFYEILCGKKPFEQKAAPELIHCHIALIPPSLTAVNKQIPEMLAGVVGKLMAKNAEERYQSLSGLAIDLEHCKKEWISTGTIATFELKKGDLPVRLNVTQKLVGRTAEIEKIFSLFEEAASGKKILLGLKGFSGLGKTMLIRETARVLTGSKGTFISGKFDSLQRNVPYYGWSQALNQLAELLLTESNENISLCHRHLNENMQGLEADILAIAPRWKAILIDVIPLPRLNPKEQQSRVRFAFTLFFKSILKITKPLLLFIDDWQWADDASIELLRSIAGDVQLGKLFMAISYRHNETDPTHPFTRLLNDIGSNQKKTLADNNLIVDFIELKPLTPEDTNEILSETFSINNIVTKELGDLIYVKTQGNPFFINQLLDYLYSKKYIWLNANDNSWKWNIAGIRELAVNENIATVIINKINDISPQNLEILTYASCLGNNFSLAALNFITQIPEQVLHNQLWEAIKENIIQPVDSDYKFVPGFYEKNKANIKFRFTHDRIQQALYSLTNPKLREELHFKAAEFIMANHDEIENIFITANHLVSSGSLLQASIYRREAAKILLEAGQLAFTSGAYESSYIFLDLFEKIAAKENEINISDYCLLIQSAYLNKYEDKVKEFTEKAFTRATGKIERSKIYEAVLKGSIAMNQLNEAIVIARKGFHELGFKIPKQKAGKLQIIWAAIKTQAAFPSKKIKEITRFPKMTDEVGIVLMRLIYNALEAFFFVERDTYPLLIFKMISLSNKSGNTPESIIGYGSYGLILAGVMNKPEAGYTAGKEAMKLFDTFDAPHLESTAGFVDTTMISHWKESLVSFEKECLKFYEKGLNTGNMEYAAWNLYTHSNSLFFRGSDVSEIVALFDNYEKFYV